MRNRRGSTLLLALLAAVINLPLLHGAWTTARLDRSGVDVEATVVDEAVVGGDDDRAYVLDFTYPRDIDPDGRVWSARVTEEAYDDAVAAEQVAVEMVPGSPATYRVEGQVTSSLVLVITLLADAIVVALALLVWRVRSQPADA